MEWKTKSQRFPFFPINVQFDEIPIKISVDLLFVEINK